MQGNILVHLAYLLHNDMRLDVGDNANITPDCPGLLSSLLCDQTLCEFSELIRTTGVDIKPAKPQNQFTEGASVLWCFRPPLFSLRGKQIPLLEGNHLTWPKHIFYSCDGDGAFFESLKKPNFRSIERKCLEISEPSAIVAISAICNVYPV